MTESRRLTSANVDEIAEWCGGQAVVQHDALDHEKTTPGVNVPVIDSENGVQRASLGDFVIRHNDGKFTIYKPW